MENLCFVVSFIIRRIEKTPGLVLEYLDGSINTYNLIEKDFKNKSTVFLVKIIFFQQKNLSIVYFFIKIKKSKKLKF